MTGKAVVSLGLGSFTLEDKIRKSKIIFKENIWYDGPVDRTDRTIVNTHLETILEMYGVSTPFWCLMTPMVCHDLEKMASSVINKKMPEQFPKWNITAVRETSTLALLQARLLEISGKDHTMSVEAQTQMLMTEFFSKLNESLGDYRILKSFRTSSDMSFREWLYAENDEDFQHLLDDVVLKTLRATKAQVVPYTCVFYEDKKFFLLRGLCLELARDYNSPSDSSIILDESAFYWIPDEDKPRWYQQFKYLRTFLVRGVYHTHWGSTYIVRDRIPLDSFKEGREDRSVLLTQDPFGDLYKYKIPSLESGVPFPMLDMAKIFAAESVDMKEIVERLEKIPHSK